MKILHALTYYRPNISGLTLYVERLARALAARGHEVTVLCARHDQRLPRAELVDGVRIARIPVTARIRKGVVMAGYPRHALRFLREHDVANVHLPQPEACALALLARSRDVPVVATYHCDLELRPGRLNGAVERAVAATSTATAALAARVVAYTEDYAEHSSVLRRFRAKRDVVLPPVVAAEPTPNGMAEFARAHGLPAERRPLVGFAGRVAAEKGIETLIEATPLLAERFPELEVLLAGPHADVIGEQAYQRRLAGSLRRTEKRWRFLGPLDPEREMPAFLRLVDCVVVPSVNSTESFGLVQAEAMLCGTPVVATDLPGVRQPVHLTGMGEIVPPRDAAALAAAVGRVLSAGSALVRPREEVEHVFDLAETVERYEAIYAAARGR